jgi:hypothetical protein
MRRTFAGPASSTDKTYKPKLDPANLGPATRPPGVDSNQSVNPIPEPGQYHYVNRLSRTNSSTALKEGKDDKANVKEPDQAA